MIKIFSFHIEFRIFLRISIGLIVVLSNSALQAQIPDPITINTPPKGYAGSTYPSGPQNFCIVQDSLGRIFVANANGVLVFDGVGWSMIEASKNRKFYKLAVDSRGRVFSGGEGDLGYFEPDSTGMLVFVSLKEYLPDSVRDFSRVTRVDYGLNLVWFVADEFLFIWDGVEFNIRKNEERFSRVFSVSGQVFVRTNTELFTYSNELLAPVHNGEMLKDIEIRCIFPYDSHSVSDPDLMIVTKEGAILRFAGNELIDLNPGLDSIAVFNGIELPNDQVALGTNGSGLYILDKSGKVLQVLEELNGLQQNQVVWQWLDHEGAMWVALFSGIARIERTSPISLYDERVGLKWLVLDMNSWNSQPWLGTVDGLIEFKVEKKKPNVINFNQINLEMGEVWGILDFGKDLLVVSDLGLYVLDERLSAEKLGDYFSVVGFARSVIDTNRIFVPSGQKVIAAVRRDNEGNWIDEGPLDTLPHLAFTLAEDTDGGIWAAYDGISRIDLRKAPGDPGRIFTLDSTHGFDASLGFVEVRYLQNRIVFGSEKGIFRFDESQNRLVPDETFGKEFSDGSRIAYNLTETRSGDVWVTTDHQTGLLRKQANGSFVYDSLPIIRAPISDVFSIYEDPDGVMWFGGVEALVRYDPRIKKDYSLPFNCIVRSVTINDDSVIFHGAYADENGFPVAGQPKSYIYQLPYKDNDLKFEFAALFFDYPEKLKYSYQLVGQDDQWSEWSSKTEREYTNLREGRYVFRIRARNIYGTVSEIGEYQFSILAPWHRTIWAYLLYCLLFLLLVIAVVWWRTRRLIERTRKLEGIVGERTEEIRRQVVQLEDQKAEIETEKNKSDDLLLNILPKETANELKEHGEARPRRFEQVTVMFTDFKGFTMVAEQLSPEELVKEIHYCFSRFDEIALRHGLEKIKTIGDAYMCAGGLPVPNDTHPVDVVRVGLEIRDFMLELKREREAQGKLCFELRLGIHTGPVVAGIVGINKFQYDIWGDTVNTASRMESSGEVGQVNISEDTWKLVKDHFKCTPRGKIPAKNKGEIGMYFVD